MLIMIIFQKGLLYRNIDIAHVLVNFGKLVNHFFF